MSRWRRWIRAWGRDEPPVANDMDAGGGKHLVKGGLDIAAVHGGYSHLAHSRRFRLRTGSTTSPTGRVGIAVFDSHSSQPVGSVRPTEGERKCQTIGAPSTTKEREIHRESAVSIEHETRNKTALRTASRRNETKNKMVLCTSSENGHGKRRRWWLSTNAHNWLRFPARQHLGTRPRTRRLLASLSSSREQDREANGLICRGNKDSEPLLTKRSKALSIPRSVPSLSFSPSAR